MTETQHTTENAQYTKHAGLLWIGVLKLLKALLFLSICIGAEKLVHRDIAEVVHEIASKLKFDPENRLVSLVIDNTSLLDAKKLREIGVTTFLYAALSLVEATGLLLQKPWAEYFTLLLTACFLPLEGYEIWLHSTGWKWGIAATNLAIVVYLLWVIRENNRPKSAKISTF